MSKIINLVNNDIFKIKILETIECSEKTIKIINLNKINISNKNKENNNKNVTILPIYFDNLKKNIKLTDKINTKNIIIYHNNLNLPKITVEINKNEKENVKNIKREIRKIYGIRKTKIIKTIKFNEIYILLVNEINNKQTEYNNNSIFKWEKYNINNEDSLLLENVIDNIYNEIIKN